MVSLVKIISEISGGLQMAIQVFKPVFDVEACLSQIRECLERGWTGMGFKTVEFEELWKKYTGLPNAYYLNSATAALNLAFNILKSEKGWADGDEVISTPLTFVSTNHAILKANLHAVFADVDDTMCLDPDDVVKKITPKTRAVCFVAFGGNTGRYEEIVKICKEHKLALVLDAAHMAGTRLNGEIPGKEADCVCWSYQAVKNLPTGDSGMICFKEKAYDEIARKRAWLGINKDTYARFGAGSYKWKYDVEYIGNKYNGNAVMAAIAIAELPHLDESNKYRRQVASWYMEKLSSHKDKISFVRIPENCETSQHIFQIIVEKRDELLQFLNEHEIFPGVHYITNTEYSMYAYGKGTCPKADYASDHVISLPCHLGLTKEDVYHIADLVIEFVNK